MLALDDNNDEVDPTAFHALETLLFDNVQDPEGATSEETQPRIEADNTELWDTEATNNALVEAYLEEALPPPECEISPLLLEPDAFVDWFAAINTFKLSSSFRQNDAVEAAKRVASGNSRAMPSPFLLYCGNGKCDYKSWNYSVLQMHQVVCKGTGSAEKHFSCSQDGCNKTYSTQGALRSHELTIHEFQPRPCIRCPDQPDVVYHSINEWKRHQTAEHSGFDEPMYCPLREDNCNHSEKLYDRSSALLNHLRGVHGKSGAQSHALLPNKELVRPKAQSFDCPVQGCTLEHKSNSNRDVRNHLQRKHDLSTEEALELVPISKAEAAKAKSKAKSGATTKPAKETWKCPVAECTSKAAFPANRERRKHLRGTHQWTQDRTMEYVPLSKAEKARSGAREEVEKPSNGKSDDFSMGDMALTNVEAEQPPQTSGQKRRKISKE